ALHPRHHARRTLRARRRTEAAPRVHADVRRRTKRGRFDRAVASKLRALMNTLLCELLLSVALFASACSQPPPGRGTGEVARTGDGAVQFRVETVVANLEVPWAIVFTPDGRMLFTERPGRVRVFENGKLRPEPLATIPDVEPTGES